MGDENVDKTSRGGGEGGAGGIGKMTVHCCPGGCQDNWNIGG